MSTHEVNCRNFKCPSNSNGDCLSARLEFVPVGGILDRLICIPCGREEAESKPKQEVPGPSQPHKGPTQVG